MAKTNDTKVEAIRKTIKKASNSFSVYRNRLIKKGLIISPEYGHLEFTLPRFKELCCVDNYCTVGMLEAAGIESNKVRVDVQDGRLVISRI